MNLSSTLASTRIRDRAQQSWPALSNTAYGAVAAARLDVGVSEDDVGALAAELERQPLDVAGAAGHDLLADLGGPGEHDLAHQRVVDQALADHAALARQHLEDALRAGPAASASSPILIAVSGVISAGLATTAQPGRERRRHAPGQDRHREIPRHDEADDAEGFLEGHVHTAGNGDLLAGQPLRGRGVVREHVADLAGLPGRGADRVARAGRLQRGELVGVGVDLLGEPAQQPAPVTWRDVAPGLLRPGGALDGGVGLLGGGVLDLRDRLLGSRVDHGVAGHGVGVMSLWWRWSRGARSSGGAPSR